MEWKDWFYFSKGEKRALLVLVGLIGAAMALLLLSKNPVPDKEEAESLKAEYRTFSQEIASSGQGKKEASYPAKSSRVNKTSAHTPPIDISQPTVSHLKEKSHPTSLPPAKKYEPRFPKTVKYPAGTVIELNTADTTSLKKVPGIGTTFARRIVKFRNLLGGYASVSQLREVYGIDEERYGVLSPWFRVDTALVRRLKVNELPADSLCRHPYVNYRQAKSLVQLREQKGKLSGWVNLLLLEEFTEGDRKRLTPYLSFE